MFSVVNYKQLGHHLHINTQGQLFFITQSSTKLVKIINTTSKVTGITYIFPAPDGAFLILSFKLIPPAVWLCVAAVMYNIYWIITLELVMGSIFTEYKSFTLFQNTCTHIYIHCTLKCHFYLSIKNQDLNQCISNKILNKKTHL